MALGTPAWAPGSATVPTRVLRHLPAALTGIPVATYANSATGTTRGGGYGVAGGGDLAVTTTGGLGYSVAAGHFGLPGTSASAQGMYVGYNDAAVTGTLPARNATNPYIAYIAVQIRDADEDATGSEDASIVVIQGTAAATPAAPAVPSSLGSLLILSEALVPSSANGGPVVFTERRTYLSAIGGVQRVASSSARPTGAALWEGLYVDEANTDRLWRYSGGAWLPVKGRFGAAYSANGTIAGGFSNIVWGTEVIDTDGYGAAGGTAVTVPTGLGGEYAFLADATYASVSTVSSITVYKNASVRVAGTSTTSTLGLSLSTGGEINLGDGEYLIVQAGNGNGAGVNINITFRMFRISD